MAQFFWEGLLLTGISGLIGIAVSGAFMALLQATLTDKIPGFDPPRIVPWSAALALGSLVSAASRPAFTRPAKPQHSTRSKPCAESEKAARFSD